MSSVLVIESDSGRAGLLRDLLTSRANTDVLVVGSKDAAMASVDERVPDLVLVDALMSPRDEDSLIAHFRTLPDAGHLQTLTIPQLGRTSPAKREGRSLFRKKRKPPVDEVFGGCDPTQFVSEVAAYLSRACELKTQIEQDRVAGIERRAAEAARAAEVDRAEAEARKAGQPSAEADSADGGSADVATGESGWRAAPDGWASDASTFVTAASGEGLAAEVDRVRAEAAEALARELGLAEERHQAALARLEAEGAERAGSAARDAQTAQELEAEVERVRTAASEALTSELAAAEQRHRADIARLEAEATERADAAAREALAAAEAQTAQALAAEVDRVRAEAQQALATELATELAAAEERRRADILRLEGVAAERSAAMARDVQAKAEALEETRSRSAEVDRLRAEAEQALATELGAAEERHRAEIARLETVATEKADAAAREALSAAEAQSARALAAEVERVRADADQALAARLAAAEERRRADVARLEDEAAERAAVAAHEAQARAEARANETLAAELDRLRADAEHAVAAQLAAAEERHRQEIARLEADAAESSDTASRDARAKAETEAQHSIAAERERVREDAARTLAGELATAQERHAAEIATLSAEAAARSDAATRLAQVQADETLAAADERHRVELARLEADVAKGVAPQTADPSTAAEAESVQLLAAELDRVRAEAAQMLKTELAAAEERSRAEVLRVKAETQQALSTRLQQVQVEANHAQAEVARLVDAARYASPVANAAPASRRAPAAPAALAPDAGAFESRLHEDGSIGGSDYYSLWQARFAGRTADDAPPAPRARRDPGRASRRWALMAAAVLVVLLTHDTARQSAVGQALAAGAAGVSQVIGVPSEARAADVLTGSQSTVGVDSATGEADTPALTRRVAIEAVGFLVGVLFLLVMLFIGEGVLWHGLVVTFGVALLMFAVMRPPSPSDVTDPSGTATVSDESPGVTSPEADE